MTARMLCIVELFLLLGCASSPEEARPLFKVRNGKVYTAAGTPLPVRPLSHASCALAIEGRDAAWVREEFGETPEIVRPPFAELTYGQPPDPPAADEQWVYRESLQHLVLYFKDGKVVLAVAEWTDW